MYKLVLILKYLRRKLAPMFAALAVTLCTAMVIIVISVMGGFLTTLRDAAHRLTGDVVVTGGGYNGFPNYEALIDRLEAREQIAVATPVVRSYGLVRIGEQSQPVQIMGVRPNEISRVVQYRGSLYWNAEKYFGSSLDRVKTTRNDESASDIPRDRSAPRYDLIQAGMTFQPPKAWSSLSGGQKLPGIVLGIEVNPYSQRDQSGDYIPLGSSLGRSVVLTVVPVSQKGAISDTALKQMQVVNEFKSGLYEIDQSRAYMDFSLLQQMLHMGPTPPSDPQVSGSPNEKTPGRANQLFIGAAPGFSPQQVQTAAEAVTAEAMDRHPTMPLLQARTWRQQHHTLLQAVQNEKGLVTFLFALISAVAVVMVATTFYMTVLEKTRDIGVLRAMGASKLGIMNLYLGYGLAIGVVGALLGLLIAWAVVTNLNAIQAVIADWTGWRMWNPKVYAFDEIPDEVDWFETSMICVGAMLSSVIGSLIPAILAARLNPVEAIRHE